MKRKVEICELCKKELSCENSILLETMAYIQDIPNEWCISVQIYDPEDKELEEKGFIVTHETDTGYYYRVNMKNTLIETTTIENGMKYEETESCLFVCRDFKYHSFLLSN